MARAGAVFTRLSGAAKIDNYTQWCQKLASTHGLKWVSMRINEIFCWLCIKQKVKSKYISVLLLGSQLRDGLLHKKTRIMELKWQNILGRCILVAFLGKL